MRNWDPNQDWDPNLRLNLVTCLFCASRTKSASTTSQITLCLENREDE
jgi:hypothetical protein